MSVAAVSRWTGAAGLAGAGILHAAWGAGSSWPLADRAALADAVVGRPAEAGAPGVPGAGQCFTVAGALVAAAAVVAHPPRRIPRLDTLHRAGVTGVVAVLASRGLLGAAGLTDLVSRGSVSDRFRRLDRRVYSPLCLGLAGLSAAGVLLDRADAARDAAPAG